MGLGGLHPPQCFRGENITGSIFGPSQQLFCFDDISMTESCGPEPWRNPSTNHNTLQTTANPYLSGQDNPNAVLMLSTRTEKHWARKLLLQIYGLEGEIIMFVYNLRQFPHSIPVARFNYMYTLQSPTGTPYKNLLTQLCHFIKLKNNTPSCVVRQKDMLAETRWS